MCTNTPGYFMRAHYLFLGCQVGFQGDVGVMDRASSQCLVAGPLTVARNLGKMVYAAPICRALGNGSDSQAGRGSVQSIWQGQQWGMFVLRGVRATTGGDQLQCHLLCQPLR